jgi:hypothetical protein
MRTLHRFRTLYLLSLASLAMVVAACSGGGSSSSASNPTSPSPTPVLGSASIAGSVVESGRAATGVRVEVDGQNLQSVTDGQGRFRLEGVAAGDRVLTFDAGRGKAPVTLPGVGNGEALKIQVELHGSQATLVAVEPDDGEDDDPPTLEPLSVQVSPSSWNTNWERSNGRLTVQFRGDGYDGIDPDSVVLVGDDPAALPLEPLRARVEGSHLKAQFTKSEALATLLEPQPGETRSITVEYELDGVPGFFEVDVRIVGPGA